MYTYIQSERTLWTVGFHKPNGSWEPESDWGTKQEAAERVHYLNGRDSLLEELLREAVELFEGDAECNEVSTDAWTWTQRAKELLREEQR